MTFSHGEDERDGWRDRHYNQWYDGQVAGRLGELCSDLEHAARHPDGRAAQQLARLRDLLRDLLPEAPSDAR